MSPIYKNNVNIIKYIKVDKNKKTLKPDGDAKQHSKIIDLAVSGVKNYSLIFT